MSINGPVILEMADKSPIYEGSRRTVKATFTDKDNQAAAPTGAVMKFIPPGGASAVEYAISPTGDQIAFTRFSSNVAEVDFLFNEYGTWRIIVTGSGNLDEVKVGQIYINQIPD